MFENVRRSRQVINFTVNVPKILDLKSFSGHVRTDIFRKLTLGAPVNNVLGDLTHSLYSFELRYRECDFQTRHMKEYMKIFKQNEHCVNPVCFSLNQRYVFWCVCSSFSIFSQE